MNNLIIISVFINFVLISILIIKIINKLTKSFINNKKIDNNIAYDIKLLILSLISFLILTQVNNNM